MSIGLIALLDDVAALAKTAAASLDDVAVQAAKAGTKAAGVYGLLTVGQHAGPFPFFADETEATIRALVDRSVVEGQQRPLPVHIDIYCICR